MWNGVIAPQLDGVFTSTERIELVLRTSDRLMERIRACGETIGGQELGLLGLQRFDADYPVEYFEQIYERFRALMTGAPLPLP